MPAGFPTKRHMSAASVAALTPHGPGTGCAIVRGNPETHRTDFRYRLLADIYADLQHVENALAAPMVFRCFGTPAVRVAGRGFLGRLC